MAKVIHSQLVAYMDGKVDGSVLYPSPAKNFSISRRYVKPAQTTNNTDKGLIMFNLSRQWAFAQAGVQEDFKLYAGRYYTENQDLSGIRMPVNNSFGLFVMMWWNWYKLDPQHVDLKTATWGDLETAMPTWSTLSNVISEGGMPKTYPSDDYTAVYWV
jgi:hypothetical protein